MVTDNKKRIQEFVDYADYYGYSADELMDLLKKHEVSKRGGRPSKVKKYVAMVYEEKDIKSVLYLALNNGLSVQSLYRIRKAAKEKLENKEIME